MGKLLFSCVFVYAFSFVLAQNHGMYKIWLETIKPCDGGSSSIVDLSSLKVNHFNRTTVSVDGAAKLLQTIDKDHYMRLVGYVKGTHGQWTKTLLDTKNATVCNFIKKDNHFWPSIVRISDFPPLCPLKKEEYHFKDAALTMKRLPPMLPLGCYKLHLTLWTPADPTQTSCNYLYARISGPQETAPKRCFS